MCNSLCRRLRTEEYFLRDDFLRILALPFSSLLESIEVKTFAWRHLRSPPRLHHLRIMFYHALKFVLIHDFYGKSRIPAGILRESCLFERMWVTLHERALHSRLGTVDQNFVYTLFVSRSPHAPSRDISASKLPKES